ncbi:MAG: hypothetical protein KC996_03320 [Phycisphaerales bacterium]|nr:hypothetical protein [Phycisphaerales bacterium]
MSIRIFVWILTVSLGALGAVGAEPEPAEPAQAPSPPRILLADTEAVPTVTIGWVERGEPREVSGERAYGPPIGGEQIAGNLRCYVALGGTRIETGAGHPQGIVIRVGLTKIDNTKPLFAGIDPGTDITIELSGVRMNQAVKPHENTGLVHLKYSLGDLEACSLPGTARNQFLMVDPRDTLGGRVTQGVNATPGGLDGNEGHGELVTTVRDDNTISMRVRIPYAMLRHLQDPWDSDLPGTFFEPIHFHAESELIPVDAEPFDREPMPPLYDPADPRD